MGLFKVIGGVVKGTATVVGGVAKGTALVAEGVIKGTVAVAEGISDALAEDEKKEETNNSLNTHNDTDCFVIEEGTTIINSNSFESYNGENTIILPSTLEGIYNDSFDECKNVANIDFSKVSKVKNIPCNLFEELHHLKRIVFPEGVIEIDSYAIIDCKGLNEIVLPSTLREMGNLFSNCEAMRDINTSKVCHLKKISNYTIEGKNHIRKFVIPQGVEIVDSPFLDGNYIQEVYVPSSVREIDFITEDEENNIDVYLYSDKIDDIENLCADVRNLYVIPEAYDHYKKLIDDIDTEAKLREMPFMMVNFYNEYSTTEKEASVSKNTDMSESMTIAKGSTAPPMSEMQKEDSPALSQPVPVQDIKKSPGNLFSDGLEELINSVAESDELTDKKKEIVLRRAVKEGEDPDEVEMVLEARFYEKHN